MTEMWKIENYMLSIPSCLVLLKRSGLARNFKVNISPLLVVNMLSIDVVCYVL